MSTILYLDKARIIKIIENGDKFSNVESPDNQHSLLKITEEFTNIVNEVSSQIEKMVKQIEHDSLTLDTDPTNQLSLEIFRLLDDVEYLLSMSEWKSKNIHDVLQYFQLKLENLSLILAKASHEYFLKRKNGICSGEMSSARRENAQEIMAKVKDFDEDALQILATVKV